jgi:hypothetical protein
MLLLLQLLLLLIQNTIRQQNMLTTLPGDRHGQSYVPPLFFLNKN